MTYRGVVFTWECDSNRHMNVMYYINKFEQAGHNFFYEIDALPKLDDKHGLVVVDQHIQYFREVFEDDCLYVESEMVAVGNKSITMLHTMYDVSSKEKVSSMKVVGVPFDKEHRKSMALTDEQRAKFEEWM